MGFLKDLLLGKEKYPLKKKEKRSIVKKEREAYLKGLTTGRVQRAKKLGLQKGSQKQQSPLGRIGASLSDASVGARSYMENMGFLDVDLGLEPKRKKTKRKKKKKTRTIVIKV